MLSGQAVLVLHNSKMGWEMVGRYIVMAFMLLGIGAAGAADLDVPTIGGKVAHASKKSMTAGSRQPVHARNPAVHKDQSAVRVGKRKDVSVSQPVIR
jgi:hypothetical protein